MHRSSRSTRCSWRLTGRRKAPSPGTSSAPTCSWSTLRRRTRTCEPRRWPSTPRLASRTSPIGTPSCASPTPAMEPSWLAARWVGRWWPAFLIDMFRCCASESLPLSVTVPLPGQRCVVSAVSSLPVSPLTVLFYLPISWVWRGLGVVDCTVKM